MSVDRREASWPLTSRLDYLLVVLLEAIGVGRARLSVLQTLPGTRTASCFWTIYLAGPWADLRPGINRPGRGHFILPAATLARTDTQRGGGIAIDHVVLRQAAQKELQWGAGVRVAPASAKCKATTTGPAAGSYKLSVALPR